VECNRYVKFGLLMEKARQLGADFFATGHYARLTINGATGEHEIKKGIDPTKDQSYVLWKLHGSRLRSILMPMGSKFKTDAKKEAYETFPYLHDSGESQDICFLGKTSYRSFISERPENSISFGEIISKEAKVVNSRGQVLGHHKGFPFYTIGQRKGFGVSHAKPLYVIKIISENNTIVVGEEEELYRTEFDLEEVNFINNKPPGDKFTCNVKIRYNSPEAPAKVEMTDVSSARIRMADPQKAVTPGQSAVFYIRDTLTGGGIIK
jgi:tRNA-specific 2-thiouridylase